MSDNNNGLLLVGAAVLAYVVLKKKAAAPVAGPGGTQGQSQNVNGELWARLLGTSWRSLVNSGSTNAGGSLPFFRNDGFGNLSTSDGVPITTGDPLADFVTRNTGLAPVYDDTAKYATGDWVSTLQNPAVAPTWTTAPAGVSMWDYSSTLTATGGLGAVAEEIPYYAL